MNYDIQAGTIDRLSTRFVDEIFFYSGQYALFYILMNLSESVPGFFSEFGHVALLLLLPVQGAIEARFGRRPIVRFLGSFILPIAYSAQEAGKGIQYVLDMAHVSFWVFSLMLATLQTVTVISKSTAVRQRLEFATTFLNVLTFLFLYFYFDLKTTFRAELVSGTIDHNTYLEKLEVYNFGASLRDFVADPTHVYVIVAGFMLGLILALGRIRVIGLKDRINELFGRYVDRSVRDRILQSGGQTAERRQIAVLFSDIRGFTSLSERHEPEAVAAMLNRYFEEWHRVATMHDGMVDKYIGDAVMILFGLEDRSITGPNPDATAEAVCATNAVECAEEMLARLEELKGELAESGHIVPKDIGIGINFGTAIVGDIGSPERINFTAVGDTVNVASRLEALTKNAPSRLVVSQSVHSLLPNVMQGRFRYFGALTIRGKAEKFPVYGYASEPPMPSADAPGHHPGA